MKNPSIPSILLRFVLLISGIVALSIVSVNLWSDKKEELPEDMPVVYEETMTVGEFGQANNVTRPQLKELFGLESKEDLEKPLTAYRFDKEQLELKLQKSGALQAEYESKNWLKIPIKFGLWFIFIGTVFALIRKKSVNGKVRKYIFLSAIVLFGIILSADPSPMGTVKDAIHLYGAKGAVFPPRMIALSVFLLLVLIFNKSICSWGCQFGTLQDMIFRLNRNSKDTKGVMPQAKIPFVVTNTVRILFLVVFTMAAFTWGMDIMELYDPFKLYKPLVIGGVGLVVIGGLLIASLFIYRPWCLFFCPFGLVGWLVEKISITRIQVNYDTCIACEACADACPSTVMRAILKRDKHVIPDCFSCATCISTCPTDSISFKAGKRALPPQGHFDTKKMTADEANE